MRRFFALIAILATVPAAVLAGETVDLDAVNRIRDEGLHRSQVMDHAWQLSEGIGPRLTGSSQLKQANEWARETLAKWGLDARLEGFEFGHGWRLDRCQVHLVAPRKQVLEALPKAWTPGTDGPVSGRAMRVTLKEEEDLEKYRGKLAGAILLLDDEREPEQIDAELFSRYDDEQLAALEDLEIPGQRRGPGRWRARALKENQLWSKLAAFYEEEGVVATVEVSSRDNGILRIYGGGTYGRDDRPAGIPAVVMTTEHYNSLLRMLDKGLDVELEIDITAEYEHDDPMVYNTIADLRGTDLADEVVLVGSHIDSWHAGTGATDDAGSCAAVMEAVRILTATGLKPRRTIRVGLWSGEEQGFLGSRAYVEKHLATRPEPTDPEQLALPKRFRETTWPITTLPEHEKLSVYFNMDYGAGRIRGIYTQQNVAAMPIFEAWIAPLEDIGVTTVSSQSVGGTDHTPFDRVGIPAFQFIQDGMDYMGRTHHTNVDTYDHLSRDDLVQASVVLATFLWNAATRDDMIPRKPMPQEPPKQDRKEQGEKTP